MIDHPAYTLEEARTRDTFLAMMWSLSYPGRVYALPANGIDAFQTIGDTLLDLETSYYTPDFVLGSYLGRNGARELSPERAAYHFYPALDKTLLPIVKTASIGTLMYPDQSATLIIGCTLDAGTQLSLSGPGIPPHSSHTLTVDNLPAEFWDLRAQANRYPRGWDIYLVDDNGKQGRVVGLPRTTQITVEG